MSSRARSKSPARCLSASALLARLLVIVNVPHAGVWRVNKLSEGQIEALRGAGFEIADDRESASRPDKTSEPARSTKFSGCKGELFRDELQPFRVVIEKVL
jgi:hypothetical protein